MLTVRQTDDIYLVVSAGRVEGIGSTDEQGIVVLLEENFNEIVTFILKQESNRSLQSSHSTKPHSTPQTVIQQQKDRSHVERSVYKDTEPDRPPVTWSSCC